MGLKKRKQIKNKQKVKRYKKRSDIRREGLNPDDYFYSGYYVGMNKDR